MLVTSIFSFSNYLFYSFKEDFQIYVTFSLPSANAFSLDKCRLILFVKELRNIFTCSSNVFQKAHSVGSFKLEVVLYSVICIFFKTVKDSHMFDASTIRRAIDMKAPFLQCTKYFHTISCSDLLSKYYHKIFLKFMYVVSCVKFGTQKLLDL